MVFHYLDRSSSFYLKLNTIICFAGAHYFDNTSQKEKEDDVVWPNNEHVYYWEVTSEVSPQPNDPTCITYTYTSHQNVVEDYNSGLIGALLICKPGKKSNNQLCLDGNSPKHLVLPHRDVLSCSFY